MALLTVTIGATSYEVYTDIAGASAYIGGMFGAGASAWVLLSADDQARTLVAATRYLDQQIWDGTATGLVGVTATTLQWPRSGVLRGDGTTVDSTTVPVELPEAASELAVLIASDSTVTSKIDQGSNIQAANAGGGTGVTFFAPTSARAGTATVMPVVVQRLVGKYLAIAVTNEGGFGQAGNACSQFSRFNQFTLIRGEE